MTMALLFATTLAATSPIEKPVTAPGPLAPLAGTLTDAGDRSPVVLVIPGSGPTDRDGNNPLGVKAASYRLLAGALAAKGISTARIDKRGMFASKAAVADANAVTIADYANDVHSWTKSLRTETGAKCIWLLGHSEGALVALKAAQKPTGICGVIMVAGPGRKLGGVMREQLRANPANAPILAPALGAIDAIEAGRKVDSSALPAPVRPLFAEAVQGFLIDLMAQDPAALARTLKVPLLILQGDRDLQVSVADARLLGAAQPGARVALLEGVNHVLKAAPEDRAANLATYGDPSLPVAASLVEEVAAFVRR